MVLGDLGDPVSARPLLERALVIAEGGPRPRPPDSQGHPSEPHRAGAGETEGP